MVKQATFRQNVVSAFKRKIFKQFLKRTDGKIQKGDSELLKDFVRELGNDFQITVEEDEDCDSIYEKIVSYKSEDREEDYMTLIAKYNKLF